MFKKISLDTVKSWVNYQRDRTVYYCGNKQTPTKDSDRINTSAYHNLAYFDRMMSNVKERVLKSEDAGTMLKYYIFVEEEKEDTIIRGDEMISEILIGFDNGKPKPDLITATRVFGHSGYSVECISQNSTLYWCNESYIGTRLIISKDCFVGKHIEKLLVDRIPNDAIDAYLTSLVLSRMDVPDLKALVLKTRQLAFADGRMDAQSQMRAALGMFPNCMEENNDL